MNVWECHTGKLKHSEVGHGSLHILLVTWCDALLISLFQTYMRFKSKICLLWSFLWLANWNVVFPERGFKPVTNFMRNLSALSSWYSVYTSAIAFIVSPHRHNQPVSGVQAVSALNKQNTLDIKDESNHWGNSCIIFWWKTEGRKNELGVCLHRSTCMQHGMAGPSPCSFSLPSCASLWITSLPGQWLCCSSVKWIEVHNQQREPYWLDSSSLVSVTNDVFNILNTQSFHCVFIVFWKQLRTVWILTVWQIELKYFMN